MNNNQTIPTMNEYNQTANAIMNEVAGKQPEEVKKRVEAVRKTVGKVVEKPAAPQPDEKG